MKKLFTTIWLKPSIFNIQKTLEPESLIEKKNCWYYFDFFSQPTSEFASFSSVVVVA